MSASFSQQMLAAHLLRRIGFGPNSQELSAVLTQGWDAYIEAQLDPAAIDDRAADAKLAPIPALKNDVGSWQRRWYTRMLYSRRQLQEKMTLLWHEYFATSNAKVSNADYMQQQEQFLRSNALGSFRTLLAGITTDKAMLLWLDGNGNSGTAKDTSGNLLPPNENYARELMQLFALGTIKLNQDGTPVLDARGETIPTYSESDVSEVARVLTGWYIKTGTGKSAPPAQVLFDPTRHDSGNKQILGQTIVGRTGSDGAQELNDLIDLLMAQPTHAPYLSKILIQKLATETPSPGYVAEVTRTYLTSKGNLKEAVRAILKHPEFTSAAVVLSQYKTPIEQLMNVLRAFDGQVSTTGAIFINWLEQLKHQVYYPPSVFSFYRPGGKIALINAALATYRDQATNAIIYNAQGVKIDYAAIIASKELTTPQQALDYLSGVLLGGASLQPEVAGIILDAMGASSFGGGSVNENRLKVAAWLVTCTPDFQRN